MQGGRIPPRGVELRLPTRKGLSTGRIQSLMLQNAAGLSQELSPPSGL